MGRWTPGQACRHVSLLWEPINFLADHMHYMQDALANRFSDMNRLPFGFGPNTIGSLDTVHIYTAQPAPGLRERCIMTSIMAVASRFVLLAR